jgi:hypothetical protein
MGKVSGGATVRSMRRKSALLTPVGNSEKVRKELEQPAGDLGIAAHRLAAVDRAPEVPVHLAPRGGDELVEDRQQRVDPPPEIIVAQLFRIPPNALPVLGRAFQRDRGDAAEHDDLVPEVAVQRIHEGHLERRLLGVARRREGRHQELAKVGDQVHLHGIAHLGEHPLPRVVRVPLPEGPFLPIQADDLLALMGDDPVAQLLGMGVHVHGETLADGEPDLIRGEDEGVVVREGPVGRFEESVGVGGNDPAIGVGRCLKGTDPRLERVPVVRVVQRRGGRLHIADREGDAGRTPSRGIAGDVRDDDRKAEEDDAWDQVLHGAPTELQPLRGV